MPINCLSVLYKHIIQVENKNVGLKVWGGGGGGAQTYHCPPPNQKRGGHIAPPPASYASVKYKTYVNSIKYIYIKKEKRNNKQCQSSICNSYIQRREPT